MTRVEQFELIRRDHYLYGESIRMLARKCGVHRRTVRQALASAVPPKRRAPERTPPVLTLALRRVVDDWLRADRTVRRKQRHTARQVFRRLRREHGYVGAESTIRRYVGRRRRELGLAGEAFVPQVRQPGEEAEVDWYEADVDFPDGRRRVYFLQVRACYSGREFHMAFEAMTQQAFLEGLRAAFEWFGGVFEVIRFDNLGAAVKKVLRGRKRIETDRFVAFRSHYLFEAEFCLPGKEGAHEKGGVEGAVGRFRRRILVPVPEVSSYEELNELLRTGCMEDDLRTVEGYGMPVIDRWADEVPRLRALPAEPFDVAETSSPRVDSKGRVVVRRNRYSVPTRLVDKRVEARLEARTLTIWHGGAIVARHERLYGVGRQRLDLDHYLELLYRKPGALRRSLPLRQARETGRWPGTYDTLLKGLCERRGERDGIEQMLDVLLLHRDFGAEAVHAAVARAIELRCYDAGAVAIMARHHGSEQAHDVACPLPIGGPLASYGSEPNTDFSMYDALLSPSHWASS